MTDKKRQKILIIEDEALVARELKSRLTNMGYEVVGIAHGREGIALAFDTRPDLMLTDIHLKDGEDGIDLAQTIQKDYDVPVVFLTAYSDEDTVSRAKSVTPYGYIIKPVENRELQIAIEMALYKFNIERELKETQQLLQTALACIGNALLFVDPDGKITDLNADAERLLRVDREAIVQRPLVEALALDPESSVGRKIVSALGADEVTKLAPFIVSREQHLPSLVECIVGPMESGAVMIVRELSEIHDPVEMLAAPEELAANRAFERRFPSESSMCQLIIAADQDGGASETELAKVATRLNQILRSTDLVSRFGENQFSVSMPYTTENEGQQIAQSILKGLRSDGGDLKYSVGLASATSGDQQPFELFRRASWALNVARESGGDRVISWTDRSEQSGSQGGDSAQKQREYHNLVLLWNIMNVVVKSSDEESLANKLTSHLLHSFNFEKVALLSVSIDSISSLAGSIKGADEFGGVGDLSLNQEDFARIQSAAGATEPVHYRNRYLFPVGANRVLYIDVTESLAETEVEFLQTLIGYVAARFQTGGVEEADRDGGETEIIYRSPRMQSIMESVKLVAPTDATVLIVGESGTGKEKLAQSIHQSSGRSQNPFVIVDCGAVVESLIESELFGHVKGAFTGADRNFAGRLKEAHGGTVLLDEVGELPLDVQVKLLRYVQEQEFAPVGSNKYERVDTRIVAATNRNLEAQVKAGRFREDLYYRLNVFTIEMPPLREREGDVLLLARHYLDHYARQYGKTISGFTSEAERAMVQQGWAGNIRELMNVINRAVILCRDSQVSSIHLGLFAEAGAEVPPGTGDEASLEGWLSTLVDQSLAQGELPPLAQWLEEDLILTTLAINADVLNRAALTLGIPETTLRRKVAKLREGSSVHDRPRHSEPIAKMIHQLIDLGKARGQPVLDVVSTALLRELEARRLNRRDAAALMGVSLPTYRKMISESP